MGLSNVKKHTIEISNLDTIPGWTFVDYLRCVSPSGVAGDSVIVKDVDGDPVARFYVTGSNFTDLCWINARIENLEVTTNTGNRAVLEVHVRL